MLRRFIPAFLWLAIFVAIAILTLHWLAGESLQKFEVNVATQLLCLFIFIIGCVAYIFFVRKIEQLSVTLHNAIISFKSLKDNPQNINEVFDSLTANHYLRDSAKAFQMAVRRVDSADWRPETISNHPFISLRDSRDFFNADSLYYENVNDQLYSFVPSALTGLGILFTFVGLAYGITFSQSGLTSQSLNDSIQSLHTLLDGAGQAFLTSITGLVLSLIFSDVHHRYQKEIVSLINELNIEIDNNFTVFSPELILNGMGAIAKQQLDYAKQESEDWNLRMSQLVDSIIEKQTEKNIQYVDRIVSSVEKIETSISAMSENQAQQVGELIETAVKSFGSDLKNSMVEVTDSFAKSAEGVNHSVEALDIVASGLKNNLVEASSVVNDTLTGMQLSVENIQASISESSRTMVSNISAMEDKLFSYTEQFQQVMETLSDKINGVATQMASTADKVETSAELFVTAVDNSGIKFTQHADTAGETFNQKIEGAADSIVDRINNTISAFDHIASMVDNASKASESMRQIMEGIMNAQTDASDAQERFAQISDEMKNACETLKTAGTGLQDVLSTGVTQLGAHQDKMNSDIQSIMQQVLGRISDISSAQTDLTANAEQLQDITQKNLSALAEALKAMNDQLGNNLQQADQGLGQAVRQLSAAVDDWVEKQSEENKILSEHLTALRNDFKRLDSVRDSISSTFNHR